MNYAKNILETIGNTPLVKINKITAEIPALILAKVETFNPGNSVKDRMAVKMIEDAEKDGKLKPGGTIIEGTSGNTGMGLALGAIVKGYKLICVISDKQSKEKMDILKAVGAEVVVCPTNVEPDDPRSYYSVSKRLAEETPNSWYVNQYDNPSNAIAHYEQTGPEIWEQTEGKITHFVVGVGTGGTISGIINSSKPHQKVLGFPALKGDFLEDEIRKFAKNDNWKLIKDYHFGGYAKINEELIAFINKFRKQTNVPLDPVYTAKMCYGIFDLIHNDYFEKGTKILLIHTGGLQGIIGMNQRLEQQNLPKIDV